MSRTEKINAYYQEQQLKEPTTVKLEVKKEKRNTNFSSAALKVMFTIRRFASKLITNAKAASANNKRALVLTFSTITFSIANILFAIFVTANKGFSQETALGLNLMLSAMSTYLFTKFVFYFVNLSKPKQAPKPKQPSPQEQMLMQLMGG